MLVASYSQYAWKESGVLLLYKTFHIRAFGDGYCKDVTVGGCFFKEGDTIQNYSVSFNAETCQGFCYETTNCEVFQHSAENCILLREDYRQDCHIVGGPPVNK